MASLHCWGTLSWSQTCWMYCWIILAHRSPPCLRSSFIFKPADHIFTQNHCTGNSFTATALVPPHVYSLRLCSPNFGLNRLTQKAVGQWLAIISREIPQQSLPGATRHPASVCGHEEAWWWRGSVLAGGELNTRLLPCWLLKVQPSYPYR